MGLKDIKNFSAEEVGMWLIAQGLGDQAEKFVVEGVDGDLLLSLTAQDLKTDLGLSSLQAKKVLKNIEFSKNLLAEDVEGADTQKLEKEIEALEEDKETLKTKVEELLALVKQRDHEIKDLTEKIERMKAAESANAMSPQCKTEPLKAPAPAPHPAPSPAPVPAYHSPQPRRGAPVVGGAARGAATGAAKGAISE